MNHVSSGRVNKSLYLYQSLYYKTLLISHVEHNTITHPPPTTPAGENILKGDPVEKCLPVIRNIDVQEY